MCLPIFVFKIYISILVSEKVVGLIRILIHTLAAQAHVCDRHSKPVTGLTMRSRDLSSLGGETDQNIPDNDTVFDVEHGDDEEDESEFEYEEDEEEEEEEEKDEPNNSQKRILKDEVSVKTTPAALPPLPPEWSMQRLPNR